MSFFGKKIRLMLLLCGGWLAGAGQPAARRFEFSHPQMGTIFKLVFYTADTTQAAQAAQAVFDRIDTLNAHFSDYIPESELSRLGATAGTWAPVSKDLFDILVLSDEFSRQSKGAFDVTVGPLTRLWRRSRTLKELPDPARLQQAHALVGYQHLHCRAADQHVLLEKKGMQLDLGGIAQGYAADQCLSLLRARGITCALVDAGGDIALGDPPPGAAGWTISIPPLDTLHPAPVLSLANCGITTSGARFRYLEINGRRYSHIIDPKTGWGLTHHRYVTVQAPNATTADAWATAISVLGAKKWHKLKRKHRRLTVWVSEIPLNNT